MARTSNRLSDWVSDLQRRVRDCLETTYDHREVDLTEFRHWFGHTTGSELSDSGFRAACAEALTWVIIHSAHPRCDGLDATLERTSVFSPFVVELLSVLRTQHGADLMSSLQPPISVDMGDEPLFLYETCLSVVDPKTRSGRGVFYTPRVIARHLVDRADNALRERFDLADGLAETATWRELRRRWPALRVPQGISDDDPFVRILDPAAGSGVFLVEVVDRIHRTMLAKYQDERLSEEEMVARWNAYVPRHLLPRLFAVELMPSPSVISQIALAQKLAETGFDFRTEQPFRFSIADTLLDPAAVADIGGENDSVDRESTLLREILVRGGFTVVLGNPPFRGISSNPSTWIGKLLRGIGPDQQKVASYYDVDGEPLRERKLWLQDDYVKFMRYAQWQIERTGVGVVGFVTNHGYLDNATFRGMRNALLETFQQIEVFDLHGNRKKNKLTPDGQVDEGMFEIEQGIAIGLFSRTATPQETCVSHRQAWGKREAKVEALQGDYQATMTQLHPQPPHYLFVPADARCHKEYEAGFALNEVMPVNSTAVVTARDRFVVGFDTASLAERMRAFCDESVSDAEIRSRFFTRSRSTKYPAGDTRGWKLAEARRRMTREPSWSSFLRPCLYRPFDRRVIFWADWMIDWPRQEVTRHLLAGRNLALVARRQMPPSGACNYFWITDAIAIDGLIRSDNRGSESIFPLWLEPESTSARANLAPAFVAAIERGLGLTWDSRGIIAGDDVFGPIDVLHYIYGLFSASTYRLRYRESLRRDFPRVLIPKCRQVWATFRNVGERSVKLHLIDSETVEDSCGESEGNSRLGAGYPKFAKDRIWLGKEGPTVPATELVWNFHVGTHQVCRKWLRDRGEFGAKTLRRYRRIVAAIAESLELTDGLDAAVVEAGGWDAVFSA